MFVAPTEPPALKKVGVSSSLPEQYGVDVYWESEMGAVGVQRKTFPSDFLASVQDGRLNREYMMMGPLAVRVLLLEGREVWTTDGNLVRDRNHNRWPWTRTQHRNYLCSVWAKYNVHVVGTDNLQDTIDYVLGLRVWSDKRDHMSLHTRPGPSSASTWGEVTNRDWAVHFLQGIDGLGPKVAGAIYDHFGGLPFKLNVSREQLMEVNGVGKILAAKIEKTFREVSSDSGS